MEGQLPARENVSPDFMLLSDYDGFVSPDRGTVFLPADLRGRVGFDFHSQLNVFLQFSGDVLFLSRFHSHKASLCRRKTS